MILFFRNVPSNTRPTDLLPFISSNLVGENYQIFKIEILVIKNKTTNELEHHGMVLIDTKVSGHGEEISFTSTHELINGKLVHIRKFSRRNLLNDRRQCNIPLEPGFVDRREQDRRRDGDVEKIIDLSNQFIEKDSMEVNGD